MALRDGAGGRSAAGGPPYSPILGSNSSGCSDYSTADGIEQFHITCSDTAGDNRAEQRVEDDYSSGARQFEGEFRVVSIEGTGISVKQTFQAQNGAFLTIATQNSGRFYSVGDNGDLGRGRPGRRWTRINTIHDVASQTHQIYVNGELKVTKAGGSIPGQNKYGAYRIDSGRGPATIEWRNVRFWKTATSAPRRSPDSGSPPGLRLKPS